MQNNELNDLRGVLRVQNKRTKDIRKDNEQLVHAIQQIEKQLQVSSMLTSTSVNVEQSGHFEDKL